MQSPVRARRNDLDLSQAELAARSGVAQRTIRNIEGGGDVKVSTLAALARVLGCEVADLLPVEVAS